MTPVHPWWKRTWRRFAPDIPRGVRTSLVLAATLSTGLFAIATGSGAQAPAALQKPVSDAALLAAAQKYFPEDAFAAPRKRIFRLTRTQLDNTVAKLLPGYVTRSVTTAMSRDPLQTNYEYADMLAFNAANLAGLSRWIEEIAANVAKKPAGVVACAAANPAPACLDAAARTFAARAFRGDIDEARLARLSAFYLAGVKASGFARATGDLVEVVLKSPDFLFRKEIDVDRGRLLSWAQMLQALSYTLADTPPESLVDQWADPDKLLRLREDADATIRRIVASPAARAKLVRFFKAWLEIKEPDGFTISPKIYPEFDERLATAMLEETDRFLHAHLDAAAPSLQAITQSTRTSVSKPLAALYALPAATADKPLPVDLDPTQRHGIFSLPAVIASHSGPTGTRPVKRGVFWVRKVMCMELEPPPQGTDTTLYPMQAATERQRIAEATRPKACMGCHKLIDPLGFFQESYDALGRWRTTDNGQPVDASMTIDFLDEGSVRTTTSVEALQALTGSLMFKQCFVRQLFRFYMGRGEEPSDDPLLRHLFIEFARNDNLLDLVARLAASDQMVRRQ